MSHYLPGTAKIGPLPKTSWTLLAVVKDADSPPARQALSQLCESYWYPLYAFLRRSGEPPERAEDLIQSFFADIIAREFFKNVDPAKGTFRSFLLASLTNHVNNVRDWERRDKRGGKVLHFSLDFRDAEGRYGGELAHRGTPERLYQRRWALTVLNRVLEELEREMVNASKGQLFDSLKPTLTGGGISERHSRIGEQLGMTEKAVKQSAYRMRKRYRELMREEIGRTVVDPDLVNQEIADLFSALST
ncbi:sigma-70 family RNA polymerase sigma factor [Singulisphaera sp. Ch08]|uniref:Sigma-70 family RNA polymerase sigma factor n=1 Tax=Singulisphaera sp. Ch08 TaxID=3120278 RepID=A0AAU7CSM9_9BACT